MTILNDLHTCLMCVGLMALCYLDDILEVSVNFVVCGIKASWSGGQCLCNTGIDLHVHAAINEH